MIVGAALAILALPAAAAAGPAAILTAAVGVACAGAGDLAAMAGKLSGAAAESETPLKRHDEVIGWRRSFALAGGGRLTVMRIAPNGRLVRLRATYYASSEIGPRPEMVAFAGPDCAVRMGRRLVWGADGRAKTLVQLGPDLEPMGWREPLDPPVPAGRDPGGVAVGMVDSGVNYLLPEIGGRLARDAAGDILGYDFWDLDPRPFDANPARSPFFPQRHGTRTASLLLREAPDARLVPYRYPRPDMSRMDRIVTRAARTGVRIVNISLGSTRRGDWIRFAAAARRHGDILFVVSAGNNGRDIDSGPVYPAALDLDNILTVTSANADGSLAPGANWGRESVDLMVPAETMTVTGFDGRPRRAAGSSFAAPRVAALAARLLARHPNWRAKRLKAAILARATRPAEPVVAHGFIADPAAD